MTVAGDVLRRLYAAPPDGFIAARAAAVDDARNAGDVAGAKEIGKLRKPTVAAWLTNLLAIRRPDLVAELLDLAGALRAAQRDLRGERLRELSVQRRQAVSGLVAEVQRLATAEAPALAGTKLPLNDVEDTLNAAMSDEDIAAQVRSGQLVRSVSYAGFGEVPRPRLRLVTSDEDDLQAPGDDGGSGEDSGSQHDGGSGDEGAAGDGGRPGSADDSGPAGRRPSAGADPGAERADGDGAVDDGDGAADRASAGRGGTVRSAAARRRAEREEAALAAHRAALDREVETTRADLERAEADLERAAAAERGAARAAAELSETIARLQRERSAAEHEANRQKLARKAAERAVSAARRRSGQAHAAVEQVEGINPRNGIPDPGGAASRRLPGAESGG